MVMHILVVDDLPTMAEQYAYDLKRTGGCVVLDLEMPEMDGFDFLRRFRGLALDTPVVVYTGTGSYDRCIQAIRLGAAGFIDKAEPMERVVHEVETAVERRRLRGEIASLRKYMAADSPLLGDSPAMRRLKDEIARVAPIPSAVLI